MSHLTTTKYENDIKEELSRHPFVPPLLFRAPLLQILHFSARRLLEKKEAIDGSLENKV